MKEDDAISRQAAIDGLYNMHANGKEGVLYDHEHLHGLEADFSDTIWDAVEVLEELPSVTPKAEPCEDAISRQAVEEALYDYSRSCDVNYAQIMERIDALPNVTPKQRTGRWEEIKSLWGGKWETIDNYKCSVCGELEVSGNDYKYCPNCGAKMESEEQA